MPCTRALGHGSRPNTGQRNHRDLRRQRKSEARASRSKALGQGRYNGVVSASRQHHGVAVARSRQLVDGFPCFTPTSKVSAAALADSMATCAYCKPAGLKQRTAEGGQSNSVAEAGHAWRLVSPCSTRRRLPSQCVFTCVCVCVRPCVCVCVCECACVRACHACVGCVRAHLQQHDGAIRWAIQMLVHP